MLSEVRMQNEENLNPADLKFIIFNKELFFLLLVTHSVEWHFVVIMHTALCEKLIFIHRADARSLHNESLKLKFAFQKLQTNKHTARNMRIREFRV